MVLEVEILSVTEFIGRFHPVLVHLPIGILLTGILLQWLTAFSKYNISRDAIKIVLLLGTFTALLSCITGYLLSGSGDYDESLVAWHMWMGIGVAFTSLLYLQQVLTKRTGIGNKLTSISLLMLIVLTGHLGGSLTHGSGYLTGALAEEKDTAAVAQKTVANVQEAVAYADVIQPVLQAKCYACHNARKQKGGLRMDEQTLLLKGGKGGAVIQPGNADGSEMMKRVLLPEGDEHHMPPKSKPQLTDRETALLHWWISTGADFTKRVKDLPQPESIKPALAALQKAPPKTSATVPAQPVEAADEKAVKALKELGVVVVPVAQGSNYLAANFVTVSVLDDEQIKGLLPLKKQLVWLKLNDTKIGGKALSVVGECKALTMLYLNNTVIKDNDLQSLKGLDSLQVLSVAGTGITVAGLQHLSPLKKLRAVYAYGTGVGQSDTAALRKALPNCSVDVGGYTMPFLESDTARMKAK